MRRTPYLERAEKTYIRVTGSKPKHPQSNTSNLRIDFTPSHKQTPSEEPSQLKSRYGIYHPKRSFIQNRPMTTRHSFIEIKKQKDEPFVQRQPQRQLQVTTLKQSQFARDMSHSNTYDTNRGKIHRGISWKYDDRVARQHTPHTPNYPATNRYSKRLDVFSDPRGDRSMVKDSSNTNHRKRNSGLFDLIGQNLKKGEREEDSDFFEYVMRFSYRTKKGYVPSNPAKVNQDAYIINPNINGNTWQHLFAICDGHGPLGHHVSSYVKNHLPQCLSSFKNIQKHPKQSLFKAFETTYNKMLKQSNIDMKFSGSTVIACYLQHNKLYCANVGDSRAIVGRNRNKRWEAVQLSTDHKPSLESEAARIRKMKGRVEAFKDEYGDYIGPLRVWLQNENAPGLAMTRSFGDLMGASVGVSAIPEIKEFSLSHDDKIMVIASDGVFQFLQNQEIIRSLIPYYETQQIQQASDNLLNLANRSWAKNSSIVDDITFILIFLNYNEV